MTKVRGRLAKMLRLSHRPTEPYIDKRPCAICALAPKVALNRGDYGRFCLYFGVRVAPEELQDVSSALRQHCIRSGNQFTWPTRGFKPQEVLVWRMRHQDW